MSVFEPVRIGLVSTSDRAASGVYADQGIPALQAWLGGALRNPITWETRLIPDEQAQISAALCELVDVARCDLVLTTGGTGPAPRDVTPEAIRGIARVEIPGFGEVMRARSLAITPNAMISRCLGAIVDTSLVLALPGKPSGAVECLGFVLGAIPHSVKLALKQPTSC